MKRALIAVAAVVLVGIAWWLAGREPPPAVELHTVGRGVVELSVSNTRAGTVKACQRSRLSMPIGGRVEKLRVDEGDEVVSGEVLLTLWNADRMATTAQAAAMLQAAHNKREQVCVEAANLRKEASRLATLRERELIAQEAADLAATRAEASDFACRAARDEEDMAAASLRAQQALLEQTVLRAPFDGVVAEIHGEIGEYVTPSPPGVPTPPAVDLIDYSCLYVTAPIDEVDAGYLAVGQPARVSFDALRDEVFAGRVSRIAPYVLDLERQARTVEIDVRFDDPVTIQRLLVGYSADIDVILETRPDVLRVPTETLLEGNLVYRYDPDAGRLQRVQVELGISNWDQSEIVAGLDEGDRILLTLDLPGLQDGLAVVPVDDPD